MSQIKSIYHIRLDPEEVQEMLIAKYKEEVVSHGMPEPGPIKMEDIKARYLPNGEVIISHEPFLWLETSTGSANA